MNTRLALYIAGSAYLVRHCYHSGGKRVAILDRTKRWRSAAHAMKKAGRTDLEIILALRCSRAALARVIAPGFRI